MLLPYIRWRRVALCDQMGRLQVCPTIFDSFSAGIHLR